MSFRNQIDFRLRQYWHWSRPGLRLVNEPKFKAFEDLVEPERQRAKEIESRLTHSYDLHDLVNRSDIENYRVNLYYLDLIEKVFNQMAANLPRAVKVADIGCSNWFYVRAYLAFLRSWRSDTDRQVDLLGYEIDAYRAYFNLYTRFDYARVYSAYHPDAHYIPAPFKCQPQTFDIISQFFPFIFVKDHLKWGLPGDLFSPSRLLADAWESLKPQGVLLIINQGLEEHRAQKAMLEQLKIFPGVTFRVESPLCHYNFDHYVIGAVKNG